MLKMLSRTSLLVLAVGSLWAGPCMITTLDQYILLPANVGCTVGPLIMENFSFVLQAMTGAPLIAAASDITVTPQTSPAQFGFKFTSSKFAESGENSVTYVLTYTEDPTGSIRSLDDVLDDPVNAPGTGEVDSIGCLGGMWTSFNVCSSGLTTPTVTVFDAGGTNKVLANSANFAGVQVLGIQSTIFLTGDVLNNNTKGGSVSMNGFSTQSFVPEPGSGWLAAAALAALLLMGGARLKRLQVRFQHRS